MTEVMRTSDVLDRTADIIEQRGWSKGGADGWGLDPASPLCIEGGILAVLGLSLLHAERPEFLNCPAYNAVLEYLGQDAKYTRLYWWNDTEAENQAQVIEVLRSAALLEAAKEAVLEEVLV